jgi:hypothetical protein
METKIISWRSLLRKVMIKIKRKKKSHGKEQSYAEIVETPCRRETKKCL